MNQIMGGDVVHALMVGHNDQWSVGRDIRCVYKSVAGSQEMGAPYNEPIEHGYTSFVRIVTKKV